VNVQFRYFSIFIALVCLQGCAPIEYSVVIVDASQSITEAKTAGAGCSEQQLDKLSPITFNTEIDPGVALVTSETQQPKSSVRGEPHCFAPFEYYTAVEYLDKAREEVGYSDYEAAIEYARKAKAFAKSAREISMKIRREGGR